MSYRVQWIAVRGRSESEILARFGFAKASQGGDDTCIGGELEGGWYVVAVYDDTGRFDDEDEMRDFSRGGAILHCTIIESVTSSFATFYENGEIAWRLSHSGDSDDPYDLQVRGTMPPQFERLRAAAIAAQKQADAEYAQDESAGTVDMMFDLPIDLAESVCGFHHIGRDDENAALNDRYSCLIELPPDGGWLRA